LDAKGNLIVIVSKTIKLSFRDHQEDRVSQSRVTSVSRIATSHIITQPKTDNINQNLSLMPTMEKQHHPPASCCTL
jgi:hypothetical protein